MASKTCILQSVSILESITFLSFPLAFVIDIMEEKSWHLKDDYILIYKCYLLFGWDDLYFIF